MIRFITKLMFLIAILSFQSCIKECAYCFTSPEIFVFELVDKNSQENLFTNGTYSPEAIEVINLADGRSVEYSFIDEDEINVFRIHTIGWKTEAVNYSINVADKHIFNFYVDAERLRDRCCSYTVYNEIIIEDIEFSVDNIYGTYTIIVE